jgi:iron(II)-dependent oxidoreductase
MEALLMLALAVTAQEMRFQASPQTPVPRRVALVIGNSAYSTLKPLPYVAQQVFLMTEALRKANFDVHVVENFKWPDYIQEERRFGEQIRPGDICLVYYSGYAMQVAADDDNFLLPVNFEPAASAEMEDRAYHFKRLQQMLDDQHAALKIFILDASPQIDAPIKGAGPGDVGLMEPQIQASKETFFISAVFPGQWVPPVPAGSISLLTKTVAQFIAEPGLSLGELFDRVKKEVGLASAEAQIPDLRSSVVKQSFYFHEPIKAAPTPTLPPSPVWPRSNLPISNRQDREEYVWIPAGKFLMGCVSGDVRCHPEEKPQHEVAISHGFWMGRNEVQVGSYRRYTDRAKDERGKKIPMPRLVAGGNGDDYPIENVSWEDGAAYCRWAGGRLPTEAEWEYAARSEQSEEIYPMKTEADSREKANFTGKSGNDQYDYLAPVRKFDPDRFGLFDMAGNVWEWTNDWFSPSYFTSATVSDPQGPAIGKEHVIRGGSWDSDPKEHLRISFRKGYRGVAPSVGFRCVIEDTPSSRKALANPDDH